jgi:prephenate dehydrogenase
MDITVVGLGVVGTSLGMALKAAASEITIMGHDPDAQRVARAKKAGAIDKSHWNLISACDGADLVLLDVGLDAMETTLRALSGNLREGTLVIDLAPVKRQVLAWAASILPDSVQFIGGHVVSPRLGGQVEPAADLTRGALFYLVAPERAEPWALEAASNLAEAAGAKPMYIDAAEHDGLVAAMGELPFLGALALMETIRQGAGWQERAQSVGGEYAALAAILANTPSGAAELLAANADNLLYWLDAYTGKLAELRRAIAQQDHEALKGLFAESQESCTEWLATGGRPQPEMPVVDAGSTFRAMFLGGLGRKRPR